MTSRTRGKRVTGDRLGAAASLMITTQGHRATTLRKIARAAGMSTGAVFANGRDKAAICADLFGAAPVDPPVGRLALALLAKAEAGRPIDAAAAVEMLETDRRIQEARADVPDPL